MEEIEKVFIKMELVLDQLIRNAEELQEASLQVISEEELTSLQQKQEELISQLLKMDQDFYKTYAKEAKDYESKTRQRVSEKLEKFQTLNSRFIDNVMMHQGLIQFEISKSKKHKP
jgi:hypothetical protein